MTSLLIAKCALPKLLSVLLFIQGVTFLVLFTNFYINSYILKKDKKAVTEEEKSNKIKST